VNRTYLDTLCRGARNPGLALALKIEKLTDGDIAPTDGVSDAVEAESSDS